MLCTLYNLAKKYKHKAAHSFFALGHCLFVDWFFKHADIYIPFATIIVFSSQSLIPLQLLDNFFFSEKCGMERGEKYWRSVAADTGKQLDNKSLSVYNVWTDLEP